MTTRDPDSDVMGLVQVGDIAGAISQLMQRYGATVHRYCQTALGDPSLAEDIQQQVFIEAFRDLPKFGAVRPCAPGCWGSHAIACWTQRRPDAAPRPACRATSWPSSPRCLTPDRL